ncbi:protein cramped-like isoform X1 [Hippoglossus hippoglossus]|uniref:protein cramped-like isoform X1 n=2 Tax=Hippoglossus hippoglossus TaxID=8267 RepID=UPI00148BCB64|nr:protein cramped-like isoform X1 [Hippoglossus hippoglossus]
MVKRKKTSPGTEEYENGMTPGSREGIGVDGRRNPSRKPDGCDEEESGEQASEERSTKGDDGVEILNPSATALSPGSAPVLPASPPNRTGPASSPQPQTSAESAAPCHDQHHFLRSSVRPPSKRIRKDSIGSAINGHGVAKSKGTENGSSSQGAVGQSGPMVSSTGGVSKASKGQGSAEKEEQAGNQKRARRQWESWSAEDKNSFFEGLYEHGKDFEAIQNNIAMKYKKRGKPANMVKNKEQVRHFYYRTWHKISKHIDFANVYSRVLKKSSQELYGLICYAELRKKVGGLMDDKNVAKLNELIQQGATTVRSKGRNLRIKAPMCRALKKLCDPDGVSDEEDQKPVRLPLKVAVELQPRSNHSWARVQNLAHNPRLRMVVELHRKVSSLIDYLKQKWAHQDQRILKSLMEREALEGSQSSTTSPSKSQPDELFLLPAETSTLTMMPGVARVVHSKASCTVHWLESGKTRPNSKELPTAQILGIHTAPPPRTGTKSGRGSASIAATASGAGASVTVLGDTRRTEPLNPEPSPDNSAKVEEKRPLSVSVTASSQQTVAPREEETVLGLSEGGKTCASVEASGGLAVIKSTELCSVVESSSEHCKEEQNTSVPSPEANQTPLAKSLMTGSEEGVLQGSAPAAKERTIEQIREEGWSARDAENVTLAELYLMFGKPGKLQLEYEWQPVAAPSNNQENGQALAQAKPNKTNRVLRCLLKLVTTEVNPKPLAPELCSTATSPLKTLQEEQNQALTPPGKGLVTGVRSPSCGRQQASVRGARLNPGNAGTSGGRSLPRSLLGSTAGCDSEGGVFAVPTTLPPNSSRHNRMFSPNKEAELAFRQQLDSINMQSDLFLSRQRKPRNRQLRKPLVVQRTLLPRTTGDTPQHVCSFSILSNSSATGTGSFRPIHTRLAPSPRPPVSKVSPAAPSSAAASQLSSAIDLAAKSAGIIPGSPCRNLDSPTVDNGTLLATAPIAEAEPDSQLLQQDVPEQNGLPPPSPGATGGRDSLLSPPSVASLLDISLPGPPEEALAPGGPQTHISDSIIELAINSAHYGGEEATLSPAKLSSNDGSKLLASSPSVSPSRGWIPSPSHDPQWYPSDSSDSTLGCLLSSMVSPDKGRRTTLTPSGPSSGTALLGPSLLDCNSHDSFQSRGLPDVAEMDSQLACMMSESSVDYIARFNDLAQELAVTERSIPPP